MKEDGIEDSEYNVSIHDLACSTKSGDREENTELLNCSNALFSNYNGNTNPSLLTSLLTETHGVIGADPATLCFESDSIAQRYDGSHGDDGSAANREMKWHLNKMGDRLCSAKV